MLTRKDFEQIQKNTGFNLELLEKVYHLTKILNEIEQKSILKENLILKGGTSLNFLYFDIPRLSIDLDFDYTGAISKNDMVKQRPNMQKEIKNIASKLGYTIKERGSSYIISRQSLQYQTIRNIKDHIKIEINYLNRISLGPINQKTLPSPFQDIPRFLVNTFSLEEITAQKVAACISRSEPRDLYDLCFLSKQQTSIDKIKTYATVYYCMTANDNKPDISELDNYDLSKIQQELQQFVRNREALTPEEILNDAKTFLSNILTFTKHQQKFVDSFFKEKTILPEMLDIEKSKLTNHPALLYKINNLLKS